mgnify:CR=1 FL=1
MRYTFPFLSISFMIFALIGCSVIENDEQIVNTDPAFPEFYIGGDDLGQSDAGTKVTGALGRDDFFFILQTIAGTDFFDADLSHAQLHPSLSIKTLCNYKKHKEIK